MANSYTLYKHLDFVEVILADNNDGNQVSEDKMENTNFLDKDSEDALKVAEVISERITPVVGKDGGAVKFHGLRESDAILEFNGSAIGLFNGIENMIKHFVPSIDRVINFFDTLPKPGLETKQGVEVRRLLDEEINPSVAMHGGHISLIDIKDDTVYIRLEGGCQGCGMADVTLKQGVEVTIKNALPSIKAVLDTTDHAEGLNPYYQG